MIKELLEKLEVDYNLCFICQNIKQFKIFLDICENEGIVFSKTVMRGVSHIETYDIIFTKYISHLDQKYKPVAMVRKTKTEYQFYSRNYKNPKDNYNDDHQNIYLDFSQILRNEKLKELGI